MSQRSSKPDVSALKKFHWDPQPAAQAVVNAVLAEFMTRCPEAANLSERMLHETGTRFLDWVDYIALPRSPEFVAKLEQTGFTKHPVPGAPDAWQHDGAMFPRFVLDDDKTLRVGIKVESVADFVCAMHIHALPDGKHDIKGEPLAQLRLVRAFHHGRGDKAAELWGVERHGYRGFEVPKPDAARTALAMKHAEHFRRRCRDFANDEQGFAHTNQLIDAAIRDLGVDFACDLFFAGERDYWQRRNRAGQVQKARQDRLGLGWANHDHHTYRSSREGFVPLVAMLEKLGFHCRERFYAGHEAGWGAQVLEQSVSGITIFADVDMSPEEILGDFSHIPMAPRAELGTVGLWCGLHGEAVLQAGMHHLECQFNWHALKDQLAAANIGTMDPFTTFPYLRQAFTEGERWPVAEARLHKLVDKKFITPAQANTFRGQGAIGSHLENLERNDGYKGFNQQGVSQIIAKTDPRRQAQLVGA